jgi:2-dehydropantoate 2-reductase
MRQDGEAKRKSEVELFSGTMIRIARKHGVAVPVNEWLYARVQEMEAAY